jgi:hypothetical protein
MRPVTQQDWPTVEQKLFMRGAQDCGPVDPSSPLLSPLLPPASPVLLLELELHATATAAARPIAPTAKITFRFRIAVTSS